MLLVENEPTVRTGAATVLSEAGFDIIEAQSAGEAWGVLESRPDVQVLLADLDASDGADGLEFARKVHDK